MFSKKFHKTMGFTLIELLVVVFIIGIASAMIVYRSGGRNDAKQTKNFAEHFAAQVQLVRQESLLDMRTFGLMIKDDSYEFCQYLAAPKKLWTAIPRDNHFFGMKKFPADTKVSFTVDKGKVHLDSSATTCNPQIIFFATGDATAFVVTVSNKNISQTFKIIGDPDGTITTNE